MGANDLREGVSPGALAVCEKHYGKLGAGCGRCPIHAECTSGYGGTEEGLTKWQERCNAAAVKVAA